MFKTAPTVVLPAVEDRPVIGTYSTAEQAKKAVGFLAENGFPVERSGIVGHDLRLVETVMGRATAGRAAAAGAATGLWLGLIIGLLMPLFAGSTGSTGAFVLGGLAYGALFGAAFALVTYLANKGPGFISQQAVVADRYDVVADAAVADDARNLLIKHNWRS
ncbi:hypothetical protein E1295_08665 [Nonomuraea mesophila]|uniref:General stress protein 17M-like domain-containing protein n=1 Tax=Nonomuraea mesophila TaxID=2530382 RepID=A0A4R5FV48_9ACTN|nr:general stress protein [Nonomuraea mesophila]TDE57188.1 hypothetical protein E1295_08665 [Nonomuraea mesophila]